MQQRRGTAQRNGGGANKRAPEWSGHSCAKVWLAIHVHAKDSCRLTAETARKLGTDYSPPFTTPSLNAGTRSQLSDPRVLVATPWSRRRSGRHGRHGRRYRGTPDLREYRQPQRVTRHSCHQKVPHSRSAESRWTRSCHDAVRCTSAAGVESEWGSTFGTWHRGARAILGRPGYRAPVGGNRCGARRISGSVWNAPWMQS